MFRISSRQCTLGKLVWSASLLAVCCGCGTRVGEMASSVKDAASQGLDKAREKAGEMSQSVGDATARLGEKAGLAGDFDLNVGRDLKTDACYVQLVALGPQRPAVLQLQSYQNASRESFPSVYARAEVTAADFSGLAGQIVEAQLFVKPAADAPTLYTRDAPAQLQIDTVDAGQITGRIVSGSLAPAGTDPPTPVQGSFRGIVP